MVWEAGQVMPLEQGAAHLQAQEMEGD